MAPSIKKITPYNIIVKWPRIIWRKFWYRIIHGPAKRLYFGRKGFHVLKDSYGIKFRYHEWDKSTLNKILPRENYANEFSAIKQLVNFGDTVFDIGANIGLHATYISRLVGSKGFVHAFEPVPDTFKELESTILLNKRHNIKAINSAMSDHEGYQTMNIFERQYHEWNTFGNPDFNGVKPKSKKRVIVQTVDSYCSKNNICHINFVKIDVEGFEKQVLNGSINMLKNKQIDYISFEISKIPLQGARSESHGVFDILDSVGYSVYKFDELKNRFTGPITASDDFHTNLYASWKLIHTTNK